MVVMMMSMMLGTGFVRETPWWLRWARSISVMGITSDLAMYLEFKYVPTKYGDSKAIYKEYGVLIRSDEQFWNGVLILFWVWLVFRGLCYLSVKFLFTGRSYSEDLKD